VRERRSTDVRMPRDTPRANLQVPLCALAACADAEPFHHRRVTWIRANAVTLARDGKTYTSGAAEFYDVNGNLERTTPPGCSTSTATRFK
jgi:hypothetical protein